jgi:hypothetical protein
LLDKKTVAQSEVNAGIEIQTRKLESQTQELSRYNGDNSDLKVVHTTEQEKYGKLTSIGVGKYKINIDSLDSYLPKDKAYFEKIKEREK